MIIRKTTEHYENGDEVSSNIRFVVARLKWQMMADISKANAHEYMLDA